MHRLYVLVKSLRVDPKTRCIIASVNGPRAYDVADIPEIVDELRDSMAENVRVHAIQVPLQGFVVNVLPIYYTYYRIYYTTVPYLLLGFKIE